MGHRQEAGERIRDQDRVDGWGETICLGALYVLAQGPGDRRKATKASACWPRPWPWSIPVECQPILEQRAVR